MSRLGGFEPRLSQVVWVAAIFWACAGQGPPAQVHVSIRGPAIRITPHLYNHEGDVARLLGVLVAALRKA